MSLITLILKRGGRLAFVFPAETRHTVYARVVVRYLLRSSKRAAVIAVQEKLSHDLSKDCRLLRATGFGAFGFHSLCSTVGAFWCIIG